MVSGEKLDQIGVELQNLFAKTNMSHLPLDDISKTIQLNVVGLLDTVQPGTNTIPANPSTNRSMQGELRASYADRLTWEGT